MRLVAALLLGVTVPTAASQAAPKAVTAPLHGACVMHLDGWEGDYDAEIETVSLALVDVRAIGDSAPGDERTTAPSVGLDWMRTDHETLLFPQSRET